MKTITPKIVIPDWAKWIAQDPDGAWWIFQFKPSLVNYEWRAGKGESFNLYNDYNEDSAKNWRKTLQRIK